MEFVRSNENRGLKFWNHSDNYLKPAGKKRVQWVDIAKAIGIIAVVIGHLPTTDLLNNTIYWWHMPLFFIIGGFFIKPVSADKWTKFIKKRIFPQLKDYFLAGISLIFLFTFIHQKDMNFVMDRFRRLFFFGGQSLNYYVTTFWFVEVYIISLIVVAIIISVFKNPLVQLGIAFGLLVVGTSYQHVSLTFEGYKMLPWDADVALITIFYMLIGYLGFHYFNQMVKNKYVVLGFLTVAALLIWGQAANLFNFKYILKLHLIQSTLPSAFTVVVFPLVFSITIFGISYLISKLVIGQTFVLIGKHTMSVMYMHKFLIDFCSINNIDNIIFKIVIAVLVPVLVSIIFQTYLERRKVASLSA